MTAWDDVWTTVKKSLDATSSTMCYAKWKQVTLHLQNGMVHSCHHPVPHKISALEVMNDPSALVNTQHLQKARQQMLDGHRPPECEYCWNVEDNSTAASDRIQKSAAPWAWQARDNLTDVISTPSYLEIDLGNTCNMKCMYCSPDVSSLWMEEIKRHGEYKLTNGGLHNLEWLQCTGRMPIPTTNPNPYLEAFWKWFPDIYPQLHTLRITGGEPLLNPGLMKIMKMIDQRPNLDLEFTVNTNLMCPDSVWGEFRQRLNQISDKVRSVEIYTSIDAHGTEAQYIRHGLVWNTWKSHLHALLEYHPTVFPAIMCTVNVLSISSLIKLIREVEYLKSRYINKRRAYPIYLDFSYLRHPPFLSTRILPVHMKDTLQGCYTYIQEHLRINQMDVKRGFEEMEMIKFQAMMDWSMTVPDDLDIQRADFFKFITEHDRRRNTNFLETFPVLKHFWKICGDLNDKFCHREQ